MGASINTIQEEIQGKFTRNLIKNHVVILLFFLILTLVMFPVFFHFFDPDVFPVTGKDGYHRLGTLWKYSYYVLDLGKNPLIESSPGSSPYNNILGIPFQTILNSVDTFKILLFSSIVLNGYCLFHLAKYLTKNYYASLLGAVIFAFTSYIWTHFWAHEWLLTLYWMPILILFLLKMKDTNKIKYSIIVGISFSLIFLSQWYTFFFAILFLLVFIPYHIITSKTKKRFVFLLSTSAIISISIMLPFFYFTIYETVFEDSPSALYFSREGAIKRSNDLLNFVTSTERTLFNEITGNPLISGEEFDDHEQRSFLGFTGLFFSSLAIIKVNKKYTLPWIIAGGFLMLISLGPVLKVNNFVTEIPLPWYLLREIPGAEIFRSIERAHVMYFFAFSILSSYGFTYLFTRKWVSKKILIILFVVLLGFLIFEMYPKLGPDGYPKMGEILPEVSAFYYEVGKDPREVYLLNVPMVGDAGSSVGPSPSKYYSYYMTIYEKNKVGQSTKLRDYAYLSPERGQYFLKQYHTQNFKGDIVHQDLSEVGNSLFNYFDIGYVVVHKVPHSDRISPLDRTQYAEKMRINLEEIFHRPPDFEDSRLFAYNVTDTTSTTPYIVLNGGWSLLNDSSEILYRELTSGVHLTIMNPSKEMKNERIQMNLFSFIGSKELFFEFNNEKSFQYSLPPEKIVRVDSEILTLQPGENTLTIKFDSLEKSKELNDTRSNVIGITSISFIDDPDQIISETYEASGDIFVVDDKNGCDGKGALIQVDAITGEQTLISDNCISDEHNFNEPEEILILSNEQFVVLDKSSGCDNKGAIYYVNSISGEQEIFSDNCISSGDYFDSPEDFTVTSKGNFLVVDRKSGCDSKGALIKVEKTTGSQSILSDNCSDELGIFSSDLQGVDVSLNGDIILVGDKGAGSGCSKVPGQGFVVAVDPFTGNRELVSDNCISSNPIFRQINDVLIDSHGDIIVVDEDAGRDKKGALIKVDRNTGEQTIISDNDISKFSLFDDIQDVEIDSAGNLIVLEQDLECIFQTGPSAIILVDSFGQHNVLSDNCISTEKLFKEPEGIAILNNAVIPTSDITDKEIEEDFNFVALGDWNCNTKSDTTYQIAKRDPPLVIALGDYSYVETADCWFEMIEPLEEKMKIVIGNHDTDYEGLLDQYMERFDLDSQYYSFDFRNVHFLMLSTEPGIIKGTKQYAFAESDLKQASSQSDLDWIVVAYHKLPYVSPNIAVEPQKGFRNSYHPLFDKYGVDLVLQGHIHAYERSYPIKFNDIEPKNPIVTNTDQHNYEEIDGPIFASIGTAGALPHGFRDKETYFADQYLGWGFLNVDITNDGKLLIGKFYSNDGTVIDHFSILK